MSEFEQEVEAFLAFLLDDESDLPTILAVEERYGVVV
jgi:hypothetical protein